MTAIVGLTLRDATIVAADREENDRYLKNDVSKLDPYNIGGWSFSFAGAGSSDFIEFTVQKLIARLTPLGPTMSKADVRNGIESEILDIYTNHVFAANIPNPDDRPGFDLVIQACHLGEALLFKTSDSTVTEVDPSKIACIGGGRTYATTLLNKYRGSSSIRSTALLALYVILQTKRFVRDVGGGTDLCIQTDKGRATTVRAPLLFKIEKLLDDLDYEFEGIFFAALSEGQGWKDDADEFKKKVYGIRNNLFNEIGGLFNTFQI